MVRDSPVMVPRPAGQNAEAEHGERRALDRPAGQAVAAPLQHLPEVVSRAHVLEQAPWGKAGDGRR